MGFHGRFPTTPPASTPGRCMPLAATRPGAGGRRRRRARQIELGQLIFEDLDLDGLARLLDVFLLLLGAQLVEQASLDLGLGVVKRARKGGALCRSA
jgi:hypothetical protein